jgi:hypothetical protein
MGPNLARFQGGLMPQTIFSKFFPLIFFAIEGPRALD